VGLALWWRGYPVELKLIRRALESALDAWENLVSQLTTSPGSLSEDAWRMIEGAGNQRFDSKLVRQVRRRVGTGEFDTVLHLVMRLIIGAPLKVEQNDEQDQVIRFEESTFELLEKGLGVDVARKSWLTGSISGPLHNLSKCLPLALMRQTLDSASDDDLTKARDEIKVLIRVISALKSLEGDAKRRGNRYIDLGISKLPNLDLQQPSACAAVILLGWLSLRQRPEFAAAYTQFEALADQVADWEGVFGI
jgi:hypothetical protein